MREDMLKPKIKDGDRNSSLSPMVAVAAAKGAMTAEWHKQKLKVTLFFFLIVYRKSRTLSQIRTQLLSILVYSKAPFSTYTLSVDCFKWLT